MRNFRSKFVPTSSPSPADSGASNPPNTYGSASRPSRNACTAGGGAGILGRANASLDSDEPEAQDRKNTDAAHRLIHRDSAIGETAPRRSSKPAHWYAFLRSRVCAGCDPRCTPRTRRPIRSPKNSSPAANPLVAQGTRPCPIRSRVQTVATAGRTIRADRADPIVGLGAPCRGVGGVHRVRYPPRRGRCREVCRVRVRMT